MSRQDLEAAIQRALGLDPIVNIQNVRVRVVDGLATLTGIVATLAEKESAGFTAAHVAGVRQVENRLTVTANQPLSDRELAQELDTVLDTLPAEEHRSVGAVVSDGAAHLMGHANSAAVAEAAHRAAAGVEGVKDIINQVRIDAGAPMDEASAKNRVMAALAESGEVTRFRMAVDAVGGEVVLRGIVASPVERERAEQIALEVPGVSRVTNRLEVGDPLEM